MFGAIGRWIKAIGYLLTGQIDSARRVLDTNPHVVRAKYDAIIRDKVTQIHTYKQAVAGLIAQQENKIATLELKILLQQYVPASQQRHDTVPGDGLLTQDHASQGAQDAACLLGCLSDELRNLIFG